jgi:Flp pilus assembly protein TadG
MKLRNKKGGVLIMAGAMLPVFIILCALTIDVALGYAAKTQAEIVSGQAADLGERSLPNETLARSVARNVALDMMAQSSNYKGVPVVTTTTVGGKLTVEIEVTTRPIFSTIFGVNGMTARASATRPIN